MFIVLLQTLHSLLIRATQWLLKFLLCLLTVLGKFSSKIRDTGIAHAFPGTIAQGSQFFNKILPAPTIASMVVCQTCHSVYQFEDCIRKRGPDLFPLPCSSILQHIYLEKLGQTDTQRNYTPIAYTAYLPTIPTFPVIYRNLGVTPDIPGICTNIPSFYAFGCRVLVRVYARMRTRSCELNVIVLLFGANRSRPMHNA